LKGVGKQLGTKMNSLGIFTISDLVDYYPRRYDDYSKIEKINRIKPGPVTIQAEIKQAKGRYVRRGMHVTEAVATDETGSVRLVWFNQPYRAEGLKNGEKYFISGDFGLRKGRLSIQNPSVELASGFNVSTARIVPVYSTKKNVKSWQIRKLISGCVDLIGRTKETLPAWIIEELGLISYSDAKISMHLPESQEDLERARRRLGFDEIFGLSIAALLNKNKIKSEEGQAIKFDEKLAKKFVSGLPFDLTDSQRKSIWQILLDMQKATPMNRLLEGDVGSGKTVVAAMVSAIAIANGFQVALMAPTEILARQHGETLYDLLGSVGMAEKVSMLVGSMTQKQKTLARKRIKSGDTGLIVGTHALIQDDVKLSNLGLVIIDEQHRFGVEQRKKLQKKAGYMPHVLAMTATPIPRSLALTLYGELDISLMSQKPVGRKPPITEICSPNSKKQLYEKIETMLEDGGQMFVVCPLISKSEALKAPSAEEVHAELQKKYFKNKTVGLLHGKMKSVEKDKIMSEFQSGNIDILVSTTVIEVGIDVANANIMIIVGADRFGLAQIHQLRGRVGRSNKQGYCYLMMSDSSAPSRRLRALEYTTDGFKLAELDLEIRGPGSIYGTLQHGALDLRVANLSDSKLISEARNYAQKFIEKGEDLLKYPELNSRVTELRAVTNLN